MSPKKTSSKKAAPKKPGSGASTRKAASRKRAGRSQATSAGAGGAPKKKPVTAPKPSDMETDVLEFIQAIDDYKRAEGRPFPTWSEILDIVKELGYERRA